MYNELINRPFLRMAYKTIFRSLDKGVLELFGPFGIAGLLISGANDTKHMQVGGVYYYSYLLVVFLLIFFAVANIVVAYTTAVN